MGAHGHHVHSKTRDPVRVAVMTVSDSRTEATDEGGRLIRELCQQAGLSVTASVILPDDPAAIAVRVQSLAAEKACDGILITGGTGISGRDNTVEAVSPFFEKALPGYGELFRALSYAEIGAAAMLSRAAAGTIGKTVVFTMPGSPAGVRLAMEKLILPVLPHMVAELSRGHGPAHAP